VKRLKAGELKKMEREELNKKLVELRNELSKLEASAAKGTLKKQSGSLKSVRRNIARVLTVLNESRGVSG